MSRPFTPELLTAPCPTCGETERGKTGRCLPCNRRRYENGWASATSEYRKAYRAAHPEVKRGQRRRAYGITDEDYATMLAEQGGVCAICTLDLPLGIDHDHVTGEVRGLLCSNCNLGIGNLRDDPEIIGSAIRYLTNAQARRMALKVV